MTINSDPYLDYIHYNVYGTWDKVKAHPIMDFYAGFDNFNFDDVYFALNIWFLNEKKIPFDRFKKVIISFHTEYIDLDLLWNFFNKHSDCEFLFLSDFKHNNIWPSNVTTCRWISWGYQLEVAVEHHGIAVDLIEPKYKLSSLSNRHEFHKACVTAYLLEKFDMPNIVLSWNNWCPKPPYYLSDDFFIPDDIKKYLDGKFKSVGSINLDDFHGDFPVANGNWQHAAYLDCAINLTNESVFNTYTQLNGKSTFLPWPYLTEKTWKPLVSGRPFIPIGQANTFLSLSELGLVFNYGSLDLSFDSVLPELDRIVKIYKCLDQLNELSTGDIFNMTKESALYNLEYIKSKKFKLQCDMLNNQVLESIGTW